MPSSRRKDSENSVNNSNASTRRRMVLHNRSRSARVANRIDMASVEDLRAEMYESIEEQLAAYAAKKKGKVNEEYITSKRKAALTEIDDKIKRSIRFLSDVRDDNTKQIEYFIQEMKEGKDLYLNICLKDGRTALDIFLESDIHTALLLLENGAELLGNSNKRFHAAVKAIHVCHAKAEGKKHKLKFCERLVAAVNKAIEEEEEDEEVIKQLTREVNLAILRPNSSLSLKTKTRKNHLSPVIERNNTNNA